MEFLLALAESNRVRRAVKTRGPPAALRRPLA
jgi:hypothetical protein